MGSYLVIFVVAATTAVVFMPLLLTIGHKIGALDNTRDPPVPRVGGLAIALGGGMALLLVGVIFAPTGSTLLATSRSLGPVMIGAGGILALGVLDDIYPFQGVNQIWRAGAGTDRRCDVGHSWGNQSKPTPASCCVALKPMKENEEERRRLQS